MKNDAIRLHTTIKIGIKMTEDVRSYANMIILDRPFYKSNQTLCSDMFAQVERY